MPIFYATCLASKVIAHSILKYGIFMHIYAHIFLTQSQIYLNICILTYIFKRYSIMQQKIEINCCFYAGKGNKIVDAQLILSSSIISLSLYKYLGAWF